MLDTPAIAGLYVAALRAMLPAVAARSWDAAQLTAQLIERDEGGFLLELAVGEDADDGPPTHTDSGSPFALVLGLSGAVSKLLALELGEPVPYPICPIYLSVGEAPIGVVERVAPRLAGICARIGGFLLAEGRVDDAAPLIRLALMIAPEPAATRVGVPEGLGPCVADDAPVEASTETTDPAAEECVAVDSATGAARSGEQQLSIVQLQAALMRREGAGDAHADAFIELAAAGVVHPGLCPSARYVAFRREVQSLRSLHELRDRHLAFIEQAWTEPAALLGGCLGLSSLLDRIHEQQSRLRLVTLLHGPFLRGLDHSDPLVRLGFRELGRKWLAAHLLGLPGLEEIALRVFARVFPIVPGVPLVAWRQRGRNFPGAADLVEAGGDRDTGARLRAFAPHYLGTRSVR